MNKIFTGKDSEALRPAARSASASAALAALAVVMVMVTPPAALAQQLPLVSRELQFHATPGERAQGQQDSSAVSTLRVDLSNLPRVPLPPGTTILPPQIDSRTGLYLDPAGERGPGGARGLVLPDAPAQQPEESLPRLTVGQVYIPPWFDDIRNVRGGRGPFDVPRDQGVRPEDLMLAPPAAPGEDLPEEAPAAPQRSAAPQDRLAPNPLGPNSSGPNPSAPPPRQSLPQGGQPGAQPPAQPAAVQPRFVPGASPPPPAGPVRTATPSQGQPEPASPIPLVSRKLNFQY